MSVNRFRTAHLSVPEDGGAVLYIQEDREMGLLCFHQDFSILFNEPDEIPVWFEEEISQLSALIAESKQEALQEAKSYRSQVAWEYDSSRGVGGGT